MKSGVLVVLIALICGCAHHGHHHHHDASSELKAIEYADDSIFLLESEWVNQNSETMSIGELQGRPRVIAIFYSSCTYACPLLVGDMKKIESVLDEEEKEKLDFVLFSMDPERDTPKALKAYGKKMKLDPNRWTLLHASDDTVRELAAVLGVRYRKQPDGNFAHSNIITLLNDVGEIVYRQEGLNESPDEMLKAIRSMPFFSRID